MASAYRGRSSARADRLVARRQGRCESRPVRKLGRARNVAISHAASLPPQREPQPALMTTIAPLQILFLTMAGWVNQQQQDVIDYLKEENRILRDKLGTKRIRFSDGERRRLAAKGKRLGRKLLRTLPCLVTPDTILRWYRTFIASKYDGSKNRRPGRPRTKKEIRDLVITMANSNPVWGYTRIRDALRNVGILIGRTTVFRFMLIWTKPRV